jgi:hypothetical protein
MVERQLLRRTDVESTPYTDCDIDHVRSELTRKTHLEPPEELDIPVNLDLVQAVRSVAKGT